MTGPRPAAAPSRSPASDNAVAGGAAGAIRPDRLPLEDLALLLLATLALALPGWLAAPAPARPQVLGAPEAPRRIDLNRAPWEEWTLLPGVGEARARRLAAFRDARGGIRSLEDLEGVPGMPRGWTERIRPFVTLGDGEDARPGEGRDRASGVESGPPAPAGERRG